MIKQIKNYAEKQFSEKMKQTAIKAAKKYGLDAGKDGNSTYNNEADAFKHAYMQYWLAFRISSSYAKKLGDAHEFDLKGNPSNEQNMDLWNNQIGREVAEEMSEKFGRDIEVYNLEDFDRYATQKIVEKIKNGELITDPHNDKRKYTNMEKERLRDEDRVFYEDEFWDELDDNERLRFREHYTNYKNQHQKGLPSKKELDAKVSTGDLIYVNDYTRSDGRKVSGYYRRRPVH